MTEFERMQEFSKGALIAELEIIKYEIKEYWEWCDEEVQSPSLKGVKMILDNYIKELKGETE